MKVFEMKKCVCGCSLRTGSLIIGYLYSIGCAVAAVMLIISFFATTGSSNVLYWLYTVLVFAELVTSVLLLIGIYKEKLSYILAWIICTSVILISDLSDALNEIPMLLEYLTPERIAEMGINIFGIAITTYLVLVVYNFRREIKDKSKYIPEQEPNTIVSAV